MTYTTLTPSTLNSDLPSALNGVTTRAEEGLLLTGPSSPATLSTAFVAAWAFDLSDTLSVTLPIPPRADITVAPVLRLILMPLTSESGKEAAFTFASDTVTASANPVAGTGAQSVTTADIALGTTAGTLQLVEVTLSTSVFASVTAGQIVGVLTRAAISGGTELAGQVGVVGAQLVYTITR
ncbi:hypothetical protein K0U83_11505 [bacterium]|nr:hypothetical protein [bacterium]